MECLLLLLFGPPAVGYREQERGGRLLETDDRAGVLSLSLSPSRTLHTYESAHRQAITWAGERTALIY